MNKIVITKTIVGAGALSKKKLIEVPNSIEELHIITDTHSIVENFRTNRNDIAPGAINKLIAKIRPAADSMAMIVSESAANNP